MRLEIDLTTALSEGVNDEPADQIAEARLVKRGDDDIRYKWRFIHLTFQEFLLLDGFSNVEA